MSSHQRTRQQPRGRILSHSRIDRRHVSTDGLSDELVDSTLDALGHPFPTHESGQITDWTGGGRLKYKDCTTSTLKAQYQKFEGPFNVSETIEPMEQPGPAASNYYLLNYPMSKVVVENNIYEASLLNTVADYSTLWVDDPNRTVDRVSSLKVLQLEQIIRELGDAGRTEIEISWDPLDWDFSIWFLLVDIFQLKGLYRSLVSPRSQIQRYRALAGDKTIGQVSDDHLAVSFGLIPFLDDLRLFIDVVGKLQRAYRENNPELKKKRYWRIRPPIDLTSRFPARTLSGVHAVEIRPGVSSGINVRCHSRTLTALHHGTLSYEYRCPEFQGFLARLAQFVDAFGILDPAAAWDVIPFSFVVDWFYGVGSWLHKNRPRFFPCDVAVRDYCESIKVITGNTWFADFNQADYASGTGWSGLPRTNVLMGTELHTTYVRRRFEPKAVFVNKYPPGPVASKSPLKIRRIFIAAALLGQRIVPYGTTQT